MGVDVPEWYLALREGDGMKEHVVNLLIAFSGLCIGAAIANAIWLRVFRRHVKATREVLASKCPELQAENAMQRKLIADLTKEVKNWKLKAQVALRVATSNEKDTL